MVVVIVFFSLAGNIMTISYIAGTTAGSVFAYVLDKIIHFRIGYPMSLAGGDFHNMMKINASASNGNFYGEEWDPSNVTRQQHLFSFARLFNFNSTTFPG